MCEGRKGTLDTAVMMRKKEDTMMLTADTDVDIVNIESKERVVHKNYCCYF